MGNASDIVAHMIVGAKYEPYLPAALAAVSDVASHIVINDNSGLPFHDSPHRGALRDLQCAYSGEVSVLQTRFSDFASARNACLDATPARYAGKWALFVDADEVHGPELRRLSSLLERLPPSVDAVDGYSRHFIGSFDWWYSMERRLCFFRLQSGRCWRGAVHERLELHRRVALPAVWFHYGHVVTPQMEAEKGRLYHSLGQQGPVADPAIIGSLRAADVWLEQLRKAARFRGRHPQAAQAVIDELRRSRRLLFADVDAIAGSQSSWERLGNALRLANYSRLLAWRQIEAAIRYGWKTR